MLDRETRLRQAQSTPVSFRAEASLVSLVADKAKDRGVSFSQVVRDALRRDKETVDGER
jgi:hypothetical protein